MSSMRQYSNAPFGMGRLTMYGSLRSSSSRSATYCGDVSSPSARATNDCAPRASCSMRKPMMMDLSYLDSTGLDLFVDGLYCAMTAWCVAATVDIIGAVALVGAFEVAGT